MDETPANEKLLDFEVEAGLSLTDPCKPLRLYWNREKALRQIKRTRLWELFLLVALIVLFSIIVSISSLISSEYAALLARMYFLVFVIVISVSLKVEFDLRREIQQSVMPVLEIDSDGVSVHCPQRNFDKIPWSYIREVKTFSWLTWRSVRIVPHDRNSLRQFAVEDRSRLTMLTKLVDKLIIHPKRMESIILTPPYIDVPDAWLPLDADEVVEAINLRLYHHRRIENGI